MWLDDDQDKVSAWLRARHEICPRCGTAESDWIDPQTKRYLEVPKWEPLTYRCPGCVEVERVREEVPKGSTAGVRVVLIPLKDHEDGGEEDDDGHV
jgi:hypothetical protein